MTVGNRDASDPDDVPETTSSTSDAPGDVPAETSSTSDAPRNVPAETTAASSNTSVPDANTDGAEPSDLQPASIDPGDDTPTEPDPATIGARSAAWNGGGSDDTAVDVPSVDAAPESDEPRLAASTAAAPTDAPPAEASGGSHAAAAASAYRSRDDRNRSVYRRANPWYRRLARGLIAVCLLSATAIGVYFGARAIQDYIDRDKVPAAGPDVPEINESSFLITSTAAGVPLEGTLSVDFETGAYEFVGLAGSPNAADNLTSPDGEDVYAQNEDGLWFPVDPGAPVAQSIDRAIFLLGNDDTADAVLTNRLRRGYIDLIDQVDEGDDEDNQRTRYELDLRLDAFAEAFPLQWSDFQDQAIPGVDADDRHPVTLWLDEDDVLVGVDDPTTGWSWQRLAYSSGTFEPFRPPANQVVDPVTSAQIIEVQCTVSELDIVWTTALATCDSAFAQGRALAVEVGLADQVTDPAADLAVASVCDALQGDEPRTYDDERYLALAGRLVDAGVCPGETALLETEE